MNHCKISKKCKLFTVVMSQNKKVIYILIIGLSILLAYLFTVKTKQTVLPETVKIALRDAGDQLLLSQNDTTSLILPVKALKKNQFELTFSHSISIQPNDLVFFVKRSLTKANLPDNYRVEVNQCAVEEVSYSYVINAEKDKTIVPCSGRILPKNCYVINVFFLDEASMFSPQTLAFFKIGLGAIIIGLLVWLFFRRKQPEVVTENSVVKQSQEEAQLQHQLGRFSFYPEQLKLIQEAKEIKLSKKECELLIIFVNKPNQIVTREELTKQVWEDNGVFVGRSLDTYISKLRKILKDDSTLKLTNVHGVGYKLEVVNS